MRRALLFVVVIAGCGALLAGTVLALTPRAGRPADSAASAPEELALDVLDAHGARAAALDGSRTDPYGGTTRRPRSTSPSTTVPRRKADDRGADRTTTTTTRRGDRGGDRP